MQKIKKDIDELYYCSILDLYDVLTVDGELIKKIDINQNDLDKIAIDDFLSRAGKKMKKIYSEIEVSEIIKRKAEELIIQKYTRDDQKNIDRECLHLKAVEGIDPKRLTENEKQKLQLHKDMGYYIESILQKCEKLKIEAKKMKNGKLQTLVKSVMDGSAYEGII